MSNCTENSEYSLTEIVVGQQANTLKDMNCNKNTVVPFLKKRKKYVYTLTVNNNT